MIIIIVIIIDSSIIDDDNISARHFSLPLVGLSLFVDAVTIIFIFLFWFLNQNNTSSALTNALQIAQE